MSEQQRHTHAHSERSRGLVRLRVWHDTLLALTNAIRTSGAACPVVLERLNNSPARLSRHISTDARVEPHEAVVSARAKGAHLLSLGAPTWLDEAARVARHAPGTRKCQTYQWRRQFRRAPAPEQHSGTPFETHLHGHVRPL